MNKLNQLLEDGKVYVDVLDVSYMMEELNALGITYWLFPAGDTEMLIELQTEEEN